MMHVKDEMIYLFLGLISLSLIGMLFESWRIILYPYLLVVGLMVLFGLWKPIKRYASKKKYIPSIVAFVYLLLFLLLDIMTRHSFSGGVGYIFGLTPSMALYMFTILPGGTIVCLLYALTFKDDR